MRHFLLILAVLCSMSFNVAVAAISDGLIGHYEFTGDANDSSGNSNNGTIIGSPELVSDRFGTPNSAYHFSEGINRIFLSNLPVDVNAGGDNTVSFWMKWDGTFYSPSDVGAFPFAWGGWAGSADGAHGTVYLTGNQSWYPSDVETRLGLNGLAGHGETWGVSNPLGIEDWMQVVAVFENSNDIRDGHLFINGHQVASDLFSAPGSTLVPSWAGPNPAIGGLNVSTPQYQFIGAIDDVRIYNRSLSGDEVAELYSTESRTATVPETLSPLFTVMVLMGVIALSRFVNDGRRSVP
jgi:hypothetical protein